MDAGRPVVISTAGHIDHGKTTLVRALTGIDTDRLEEEKRRGITIVLGFAPLSLPGGRPAAVIDVPGHERFVRTMVAGAVGIDIGLLVVSAEEGVMPQTREHLAILELLAVPGLVVAVTRADAVEPDLCELAMLDVRDLLQGSPWNEAPVLAVSGRTGQGLPELLAALARAADLLPPRERGGPFRMPLDRSFVRRGIGVVGTGTAWAGTLSSGSAVELLPQGLTARVRTVQVHGTERAGVQAGERVALSLQGIDAEELRPGTWVVTPQAMSASRQWDVAVQLLPAAPFPLRDGGHARVHHGTAEALAELRLWDEAGEPAPEIGPSGRGFARLIFPEPMAGAAGDRIVLRCESPLLTLGGGRILDPLPPIAVRRRRAVLGAEIRALSAAESPEDHVHALLQRHLPAPVAADELRRRLPWAGPDPKAAAHALCLQGRAFVASQDPPAWVDATVLVEVRAPLLSAVAAWHGEHPLLPGPSAAELRGAVRPPLIDGVLLAALDALTTRGELDRRGSRLALPGRGLGPDARERATLDVLLQRFADGGFHPPPVEDALQGLAPPPDALLWLLEQGELVRVAEDFLIAREPYRVLVARVVAHIEEKGGMSPVEFKELAGLSRRHAIPFLEHLDRVRITSHRGEGRVLRDRPGWLPPGPGAHG
jgi:selenocysteine-specific elongation factor